MSRAPAARLALAAWTAAAAVAFAAWCVALVQLSTPDGDVHLAITAEARAARSDVVFPVRVSAVVAGKSGVRNVEGSVGFADRTTPLLDGAARVPLPPSGGPAILQLRVRLDGRAFTALAAVDVTDAVLDDDEARFRFVPPSPAPLIGLPRGASYPLDGADLQLRVPARAAPREAFDVDVDVRAARDVPMSVELLLRGRLRDVATLPPGATRVQLRVPADAAADDALVVVLAGVLPGAPLRSRVLRVAAPTIGVDAAADDGAWAQKLARSAGASDESLATFPATNNVEAARALLARVQPVHPRPEALPWRMESVPPPVHARSVFRVGATVVVVGLLGAALFWRGNAPRAPLLLAVAAAAFVWIALDAVLSVVSR